MGICLPSRATMAGGHSISPRIPALSLSNPRGRWKSNILISVLPDDSITCLRDNVVYGGLPYPERQLKGELAFSCCQMSYLNGQPQAWHQQLSEEVVCLCRSGVRRCSISVKISEIIECDLFFLVQFCSEYVILTPVLSPPDPIPNPNDCCSPPPPSWNNSLSVLHN